MYDFLFGLYGRDALSAAGLSEQTQQRGEGGKSHRESHDLVPVDTGHGARMVADEERVVDKANFNRETNQVRAGRLL